MKFLLPVCLFFLLLPGCNSKEAKKKPPEVKIEHPTFSEHIAPHSIPALRTPATARVLPVLSASSLIPMYEER
jgi:hypothetical protein